MQQQQLQQQLLQAIPPAVRHGHRQTDRWAQQLRLSHHDCIVAVMSAFRVSEMPVQGKIIITQRHLCFCPTLQGLGAMVKIRYSELLTVAKERVFSLFPTGVRITTTNKRTMIFTNVGSRDKLLKRLNAAWDAWKALPAGTPTRRHSSTDANAGADQPQIRSPESGSDSGIEASPQQQQQRGAVASEQQQEQQQPQLQLVGPRVAEAATPATGTATSTAGASSVAAAAAAAARETSETETDTAGSESMDSLESLQTVSSVRQILLVSKAECLGVCGILAAVLLTFCTISALVLSMRMLSLQQQILEIPNDYSSEGFNQRDPSALRDILSTALNDLSVLSSQLGKLSRALSDFGRRQK